MSNFIQTRKNTERNQIIYRAAGPIIGAAVSGTLGYLLKDYVSVAPFIGFYCVMDNALNLSPLYSDGSDALEAWHKLQALREMEKEFIMHYQSIRKLM